MKWMALIISLLFCVVLGLSLWFTKKFRRRYLEPIFMGILLFGIFALCQPLWFPLYQYGFPILLTGTLGYIFAIHVR